MIINKSGIAIRMNVVNLSVIGRATQGVRLINLEKRNDEIASVCKVLTDKEEEIAQQKAEREAKDKEDIEENEPLGDGQLELGTKSDNLEEDDFDKSTNDTITE